jgi:hypothetical protein
MDRVERTLLSAAFEIGLAQNIGARNVWQSVEEQRFSAALAAKKGTGLQPEK